MRSQPTPPHAFVMPVVRETMPAWFAERPGAQRHLVAASLIAVPDKAQRSL